MNYEYLRMACLIWFACFHYGFRLFARVMYKTILCPLSFLSDMQSNFSHVFWDDACHHFVTEELLMQVYFWTYQIWDPDR